MRLVLHGFSDASDLAVCSLIFVVAYHEALPVRQNLLVGKSRIAPRNTSIPRKELVAAHTLSQLMNHAKQTLENQPIDEYHCWVDSTTILYWIKGQGTWSVFVRNRTKTIQEKNYLQWHYVPTSENPSDQGSRGVGPGMLSDLWFHRPDWLTNERSWPQQPQVTKNTETKQEKVQPKPETQFLATGINGEWNGPVDALLFKFSSYQKLLRVTAYIKRFTRNCKGGDKRDGPPTEELQVSENFWIIQAQSSQDLKPDVQLKIIALYFYHEGTG